KEALAGLVAYGAIAWLLAGPISERLAEREHIPACIAGVSLGSDRGASATLQDEVARRALKQLPEPVADVIQLLRDAKRGLRNAETASVGPARCRCLAQLALGQTSVRFEHAIYVGTLKLIAPPSTTSSGFRAAMAAADPGRTCQQE
ncbi:MAG TPA: hypothetical protein PK264_05220, partial [Hyphomicrobiaceae bacterium]|nr:hypothetical protein [Hyphomicrobiaceae bacterium]